MEWFIFAFLSAIAIAGLSIMNKKGLMHEHALEFSASRGVLMLVMVLILIPFANFKIPWNIYIFIWFVSVLIASGTLFYMKSVKHSEVSSIIPIMNISPIFLMILAFIFLGERISSLQIIGVILLVLGTYVLQVGASDKGLLEPVKKFLKSKYIHYMIFAIVIFSITATLDKIIISNYTDFITYLFLIVSFTSLNFIIIELYKFGYKEIIGDIKKDLAKLFFSGFFRVFADIFYFIAVSMPAASITLIVAVKRTATLFTTIFGGKLFHEKNLFIKILACIIMIWGAVFILL